MLGRHPGRPFAGQWSLLGGTEHRELARRAVRQSLVLLKNNQSGDASVLPVRPGTHVLVAGPGAGQFVVANGWLVDELAG